MRIRDVIAMCVVLLAVTMQTSSMKINLERLLLRKPPSHHQQHLDTLHRMPNRKRGGDIIERPDDQNEENKLGGTPTLIPRGPITFSTNARFC